MYQPYNFLDAPSSSTSSSPFSNEKTNRAVTSEKMNQYNNHNINIYKEQVDKNTGKRIQTQTNSADFLRTQSSRQPVVLGGSTSESTGDYYWMDKFAGVNTTTDFDIFNSNNRNVGKNLPGISDRNTIYAKNESYGRNKDNSSMSGVVQGSLQNYNFNNFISLQDSNKAVGNNIYEYRNPIDTRRENNDKIRDIDTNYFMIHQGGLSGDNYQPIKAENARKEKVSINTTAYTPITRPIAIPSNRV